jgi:CRP/FNR family transcriptional regulator
MREGQPGDKVSVICRGQVLLSCISRDGKRLNLGIATPGDLLGLLAVVSNRSFEATAEIMVESELKLIDREKFLEFINAHSEVARQAMEALASSYEMMFATLRSFSFSVSVAGRIADLFLRWGLPDENGSDERHFTMNLTHDDLARFAATTRETVSRILGRFQRDNLIRIQGVSVRILAPEELEKLIA